MFISELLTTFYAERGFSKIVHPHTVILTRKIL
jgi:hypothetical protein